ncbi:hypothetical protein PsorP6_012176 [Peronosclerospora sorghi]|uniref:Uncharacterized protein n=1 Tax=Peronosclerospora sorghi TaxID=230839 RepID=A0ACC0WKL1_9STRA|nr:hypothetical protein PsorP6_012176 [Peronosclerospora sorghi]
MQLSMGCPWTRSPSSKTGFARTKIWEKEGMADAVEFWSLMRVRARLTKLHEEIITKLADLIEEHERSATEEAAATRAASTDMHGMVDEDGRDAGRAAREMEQSFASKELEEKEARLDVSDKVIMPDAHAVPRWSEKYQPSSRFSCITNAATYEASHTRIFLQGRTETTRSCSASSVKFTNAMTDASGAVTKEEKRNYLLDAMNRYVAYMRKAGAGRGVDRHLLGLKLLVAPGERVPFLEDPVMATSGRWLVSRSHLSHDLFDGWAGAKSCPTISGLPTASKTSACSLTLRVANTATGVLAWVTCWNKASCRCTSSSLHHMNSLLPIATKVCVCFAKRSRHRRYFNNSDTPQLNCSELERWTTTSGVVYSSMDLPPASSFYCARKGGELIKKSGKNILPLSLLPESNASVLCRLYRVDYSVHYLQ